MSQLLLWKQIVISQISSGSVSLIASSAIVTFLALNGLTNPYRRTIFGLSVSDIIQSFAIVTGPFLSRTDSPQALWAVGNAYSCQFNGFLFMTGATAVPMYTLGLCIYYVCKLKGKMSDSQFAHRVEKKMHVIIILSNLVLHLTALGMGTINPSSTGNVCLPAAWPTGCRQRPEIFGECDQKIEHLSGMFIFISNILMPIICLVGIIVCLVVIFWNVVVSERIFGSQSDQDEEAQEQEYVPHETDDRTNGVPPASTNDRHDLRAISRLYKRELLTQAFCYMIVFLLSTMPFLTINLLLLNGSQPSKSHYRSSAIFYPLGGFFNIVVYSRMNVESFVRKHPDCSRVQAFWLVLKAGGGMPSDEDWNASMAWGISICHLRPYIDESVPPEEESHNNTDGNKPKTDEVEGNKEDCSLLPSGARDHEEDSKESASLFPITHADVGEQETVSDLRIMMRSRPYVSSSIPDSDQGMIGGSTANYSSRDLEGFSSVQEPSTFKVDHSPRKNMKRLANINSLQLRSVGMISSNFEGSHDLEGLRSINESSVSGVNNRIDPKLAGIISSNNLDGFSNVEYFESLDEGSGTKPHNSDDEDLDIMSSSSTPPATNTDIQYQQQPRKQMSLTMASQDPSLPGSALALTGMSQSFDERNPAHRPSGDWDYEQGESSPDRDMIIVSTAADTSSCKLSSISYPQEQETEREADKKEKDDIWADTFERVRRWQPSE